MGISRRICRFKGQVWEDEDPPPREFRNTFGDNQPEWLGMISPTSGIERVKEFLPMPSTEGQKKRQKRNVLIVAANSAGFPQRYLAEVFDLPRSRIAEIIEEYKGYISEREI